MLSLSSTGGGGFSGIMRRTTGLARAGAASPRNAFPRLMAHAFLAQPRDHAASRRARAVQAIGDLGSRCHRPQADQPADFFVGPEDMAGAMRADRAAKMAALRSFPTRRSFQPLVLAVPRRRPIPSKPTWL